MPETKPPMTLSDFAADTATFFGAMDDLYARARRGDREALKIERELLANCQPAPRAARGGA